MWTKWIGAVLAGILLLALVLVVVVLVASEAGAEVVVLTTYEADGDPVATRLWVVEYQGTSWLRAGVPTSAWLERLERDPRVTVTRGKLTQPYRAVAVRAPAIRAAIHARMRERYGLADRIISMIRDADRSVMVRLDPSRPHDLP